MSLWCRFWSDERGAIVSTELVAVGTVAVIGGTVGLNQVSTSINREMEEMAFSVRSLNQSYSVAGHASCGAWTAGSCYTQPDVAVSIAELRAIREQAEQQRETPKQKAPKKKPKNKKQRADDEEAAFLGPMEITPPVVDPVEPADDASQVEVVVEPAPDA